MLLGPTGSGKTPLGLVCERSGLWGKRCAHFDFGAELRRIGAGARDAVRLPEADLQVVRESLRTGALLENENFHIARAILDAFVRNQAIEAGDLLLLNGLPRHLGQARDLDPYLQIGAVICLHCERDVVCGRIARDIGGDRAKRTDDSSEAIENKLRIFHERSAPLVDHYRQRQARIIEVTVSVDTSAEQVHRRL